jgi:hypothetical protein
LTVRLGTELARALEQAARDAVKNILDAGPLVAALNRQDRYHAWAGEALARLGPPFHTCAEALAEASALTGRPKEIVEMVQAGDILATFALAEQAAGVLALLRKYADRGMDLADAWIVRMSELARDSRVVICRSFRFLGLSQERPGIDPVGCPARLKGRASGADVSAAYGRGSSRARAPLAQILVPSDSKPRGVGE